MCWQSLRLGGDQARLSLHLGISQVVLLRVRPMVYCL